MLKQFIPKKCNNQHENHSPKLLHARICNTTNVILTQIVEHAQATEKGQFSKQNTQNQKSDDCHDFFLDLFRYELLYRLK